MERFNRQLEFEKQLLLKKQRAVNRSWWTTVLPASLVLGSLAFLRLEHRQQQRSGGLSLIDLYFSPARVTEVRERRVADALAADALVAPDVGDAGAPSAVVDAAGA